MHCKTKKVRHLVFENFIKMTSRSALLGSFTSRIKGDHAYRSGVKGGVRLLFTIEPDKKHSYNAIVVKSRNNDIVGHVPETLAKKLFNFMKSQQIEIMNSEVTGDPRLAPEGKWVVGGGIEITCKYRLNEPKIVKKKFELRLNDFQNSFVIIFMSFLDTYRKAPKIL